MAMNLKKYFEFEQKPKKGLAAFEWVIMAYAAITLLIMLFCYTKLQNPEAMIWGRVRIVAITIGLWAAYRFIPCRAVMFLRVLVQMLLLGWWYMDTYNINSLFPNLDHIVASWDEYLFGFQPAMVFATKFSQPVLSEFLEISYASYYPIIIVVCVYYFLMRYHEFEKCCFIITGAFFTYYLIFDIIPVAGPMYYYPAIGYSNVAKGVFPAIGNYFTSHLGMMKPPGWTDGIGYQLITSIHGIERPTGAFPSSHIGITIVSLILAAKTGSKKLVFSLLPFAIGIFFATVYIRAHYAIDAVMGLVSGVLFYLLWASVSRCMTGSEKPSRKKLSN